MTHNPQPRCTSTSEFAKASEFGQILVNGTFTFALMIGLTIADTTLGTLIANLGYDKLVMPKPVFIGDTMRANHRGHRAARLQIPPDYRHHHLSRMS
jgi:acyl dehydratase